MFNTGYNNFYPYQAAGKGGLFSLFKGKVNWSTFLSNTQKTLNIINQAIPVFYQIKPAWNNTKTIFKIMGAIKDDDKPKVQANNKAPIQNNIRTNTVQTNTTYDNVPNFFL
ncbi:MAG: hypothetical protein IJO43_01820 [Bacilli bacterium]|nr:hypothetical protein [Bacilli bacterium]